MHGISPCRRRARVTVILAECCKQKQLNTNQVRKNGLRLDFISSSKPAAGMISQATILLNALQLAIQVLHYSDHRRGYTAAMTYYLSEIGVPRLEHSTILDKIFQVVRSASPQRTILVLTNITVPAIDTLVWKNPTVYFNLKYSVDGELRHETHRMRDVDYHGSLTVESFGAVPRTARFVRASTKPMGDYHQIGSHVEVQTGTAEFVELDSTPLWRLWPSDMYRISKAGQEEDDDSSSSEDEVFEPCEVCLKDNAHWKFDCPYLVCIPNAKDVPLGNGYDLFCKRCPRLGVHAAHGWKGRAIMKNCGVCHENGQHWSSGCPKRPNPKPFGLLLSKLRGEPEVRTLSSVLEFLAM